MSDKERSRVRLMTISGPDGIFRPRAIPLSVKFHYYESERNVVGSLPSEPTTSNRLCMLFEQSR